MAGAEAFSVLYPDPEAGPPPAAPGWSEALVDLNLDQVFEALVPGRGDQSLRSHLHNPLTDEASVTYRQDVFRDLGSGLAPAVEAFVGAMRSTQISLAAADQRSHPYERAAWFLEAGRTYCDAVVALRDALERGGPASDALRRCRAYLHAHCESARFAALRTETERLDAEVHSLDHCVHIESGQVTVSDHHGEPDYGAEVLATFEKFRVGDVENRLLEFRHDFQNHVQRMIVDRLAILHPDLFRSLLAYRETHVALVDPTLARLNGELQVYLGYLAVMEPLRRAGLPFCHPEVSASDREVRVTRTFDLALARKLVGERREVILNDVELHGAERIAVISGPNQGGKTTFARTFGQLHHLAALGFPVPGAGARLFLADRVLTHFARQEHVEDLHSGLEDELLRVRDLLRAATSRSVVVMNESFASTTAEDQLFLGREMLQRLIARGVLGVYVTFIDELSRIGPGVTSVVSTVNPANPVERTFRMIRRPADGRAHALVLAEAHGLTLDAIRRRVRP